MSGEIINFKHSTSHMYICAYRKSKLKSHLLAALKANYGFTVFAAIEFGFYNDIFSVIRKFNRDNPKEEEEEFYDDDGTFIFKKVA